MQQTATITGIRKVGAVLILVLFAILPFHAFIAVSLGRLTGQPEIVALWKELLTSAIIILGALIGVRHVRKNGITNRWWHRPDFILILLILVCGLVASIAGGAWRDVPLLVGLKTSVLPLILFLAVQVFSRQISARQLSLVILIPAAFVAGIALWQFFATPTAFFTQLGYGPSTILPYQGLHPDFPFGRSFASLGGPNQLGTYLIIPAAIALAYAVKARRREVRLTAALGFTVFVLAAVTSFSRSALLGLAVAGAVAILLAVPKKFRVLTLGGFVAAGVAGGMAAWAVLMNAKSSAIDRFLLRGELTASGVFGGDEGHVTALVQGYEAIVASPVGRGIGAAGPASLYGLRPLITENWYLQIAVEFGIIGLGLMLMLLVNIMHTIRRHGPQDPLRIGFVGAFAGIMVANLFLHSFADSTLGLLTFGVAGLLYASRSRA